MRNPTSQTGKGFLICISNPIKNASLYFANEKSWGSTSISYQEDYSKNVIVDVDEAGFFIYLGDRHFTENTADFLTKTKNYNEDTLVGTTILYSAESHKVVIQSDYLGTEPVYYLYQNGTFWLTDRIENMPRVASCTMDLMQVYASVHKGATISDRTVFNEVKQTRPLQRVNFDGKTGKLSIFDSDCWRRDNETDPSALFSQISERFKRVIEESPKTNLMLSAGWDSRLLLTDVNRLEQVYSHGDLASREIEIAFQYGVITGVPFNMVPLQYTAYDGATITEMLQKTGQCLFPHWYSASKYLHKLGNFPLSAGLACELVSGHYGVNSLPGKGKLMRTLKTMLAPNKYEAIEDDKAIEFLTTKLSQGFVELPWFFSKSINFEEIKCQYAEEVRACLRGYSDKNTSGIHELCERFKLEHDSRQYFSYQTKSAIADLGYNHPYSDAKLNKLALSVPYKYRANYRLSQYILKKHAPHLLSQALAATLISARFGISLQEFSRFARIIGEKIYTLSSKKLPKGLGWNNFQFLHDTATFHDYTDMLVDEIWDKDKIHLFIKKYRENNGDAYSLLILFTKMLTTDYRLNPSRNL
ncbi:hypothetical protein OPS25_01935 [Alteromonas ponticola]|uniref:Asparagine synthetase domain-containing protein n=1 Tax=Alteromonas aquimaris TaxID=2998417 RepID=A0ABT3P3D4_9ALTE|nr:hypothetical protein [Alteromonas aquimaris]MCW8107264.1 hypothetical protein [Alteromonas aquimaris]